MEQELTIQQVAAATGLSVYTLRYYERCNLIAPIGRSTSGHRRYSANDLRWIEFLNKLRLTGMPIRQMQEYAELVRSQPDSGFHSRRQILESHREAVLAQIQQLQDNLAVIDWKIQHYSELEVTLHDSLKPSEQTRSA
ncbi:MULTISPECIES: MerR family transcriptional regulator [Cyanophyceae]|uniref:MerR family transcriptional regulator n=1 Tax=Cyanophyceae TaxID=3028117 RepID=UPI001685727C|nr:MULTISPECIES: MerR family transcriptional regulator [Cyanophyceae]MBD1915690.1 MerR family transcriptional regulator [Phormidium sp. FACHB-77]MBD2029061.1 MerR family transcriptional regulator [Phormidium sp. FACHB-322]MBD2052182.1 MerR family transcriptional regulator [Leptolyngbya sp. FACHB-60]